MERTRPVPHGGVAESQTLQYDVHTRISEHLSYRHCPRPRWERDRGVHSPVRETDRNTNATKKPRVTMEEATRRGEGTAACVGGAGRRRKSSGGRHRQQVASVGGQVSLSLSPGTLPPSFAIPALPQRSGTGLWGNEHGHVSLGRRGKKTEEDAGGCAGRNNGSHTCPCPDPRPREYVTSCGKRDFADVTTARILRRGD